VSSLILKTIIIRISRSLARKLLIGGLALDLLGALVLVWGALSILRAMRSKHGIQRPNRVREKASVLVAFLLITAGLFSQTLSALARSIGR
jgi:hypothetical protein